MITTSEAARALEQELIDAVIACLSESAVEVGSDTNGRHADIMARFEDLLQAHPDRALTSAEDVRRSTSQDAPCERAVTNHLGHGTKPLYAPASHAPRPSRVACR